MVLNSPRGTADIFGKNLEYRNFIIKSAAPLFEIFNYSEIITPAFEHTEVFSRSIGTETDIVSKEMYTFIDKKGRSLTLRPEGTASVVRAVVENKMYTGGSTLKLFYVGNMFRYERPQKGRMREFWQLGIEAFGSDNSILDAEAIWILNLLFKKLGFKNLALLINSLGCHKCREDFLVKFSKYLKPLSRKLCSDCRIRAEKNPMRIFDCKKEGCREVLAGSPKIISFLCRKCTDHLNKVLEYLEKLGINYRKDESLVRGFDYYTRTIFEMVSGDIKSAQNALGGGGRYDRLVKQFGGPDIPAIGFAVGIDRTVMLMEELGISPGEKSKKVSIYFICMEEKYQYYCLEIIKYFREKNLICDMNFSSRNLKSEIKQAGKKDYDFAVIVGEEELKNKNITIKDLKTFKQYKADWDREREKILKIIGAGEHE